MNEYEIILKPIVTEKSTREQENNNIYTFYIHKHADKKMVLFAINKIFKVDPISCRIANEKPKKKVVVSKSGQKKGIGKTSSHKKAYITLKEKDKINFFEGS